eukprot:TRINITY_DN5686_c0_g1_i1.p1 TRINITY_DN5686_c0_g1~~TRINITY_DN5686_c0_g1_i1.p1  ORF type:complete len:245 (-),score=46.62 TRINITY_DN5686_c0_g1_i1:256-990(-)
MTRLAKNFVYAGSSITITGVSAFDDQQSTLYYATDAASAFIFGVDVSKKALTAPIDIGAANILDLKMDNDNETLYVLFQDSSNSVLMGTYSTEGGPIEYIANFTDYLISEAGQVGESALDDVNDLFYFISYTSSGEVINTLQLRNNLTTTSNVLSSDCQLAFDFLFTNPSTNQVYGVLEIDGAQKTHYSLATLDASGQCNATLFSQEPVGLFTAYSYSPYSNKLYYSMATDSSLTICFNPITHQ